jgi:hypothetical protein
VRAQEPRQGFLVAPPIYRHRPEPLPGGELYAQVAKSAAMDRHQIARLRAAVPKGVEGGDEGRGERQHAGRVAAVASIARVFNMAGFAVGRTSYINVDACRSRATNRLMSPMAAACKSQGEGIITCNFTLNFVYYRMLK